MTKNIVLLIAAGFILVSLFLYSGCSSSRETNDANATQAELNAARQKLDALTNENSLLKQQIFQLEQDNRNLKAKAAQLETMLAEQRSNTSHPQPEIPKPQKPIITSVDIEYQMALAFFKQKKYMESAEKLNNLINFGVKNELEDNCYYWLGECYFGMKEYNRAIEYFQKVFTYNSSEKKDDAAIMIANAQWEMGNKKEAIREYKKFLEKFPASPYVKRAKARISE